MKHIIALHREVSMSTSASMFGPAVAMAAEAIERAPDIMMRLRRLQFAERLLPRGRPVDPDVSPSIGVCWGVSHARLASSTLSTLAPPSTEFYGARRGGVYV